MKEKMIKVLTEKYKTHIDYLTSKSSSYMVYVNTLDDVKPIENDLKDFIEANLIDNFCINYINNRKQYKVMFFVEYGWADGIEKN